MDPVTAFSLAGTILQFIDTGSKFVLLAHRLYRTASEDDRERSDVSKVTGTLLDLLPKLKASADSDDDEQNIRQLAKDCGRTALQLLNVLKKLNMPESPRKRDALKIAFRMIYKEDEIKLLQDRLNSFRAQLNLELLYSLR